VNENSNQITAKSSHDEVMMTTAILSPIFTVVGHCSLTNQISPFLFMHKKFAHKTRFTGLSGHGYLSSSRGF
jgi:hypothetical protein